MMDLPRLITHDKQYVCVQCGMVIYHFHYRTLVAFEVGRTKCVRQNIWSRSTAAVLNRIDGGDKDSRMSEEEFRAAHTALTTRSRPGLRRTDGA